MKNSFIKVAVNTVIAIVAMSTTSFAAVETTDLDAKGVEKIVVENLHGKVTLQGEDTLRTKVELTKNAFGMECELTILRNREEIDVKLKRLDPFFKTKNCDVDLNITLPRALDTEVRLGSGTLSITDLTGTLTFETGDAKVTAIGGFKSVKGKVGKGNIRVDITSAPPGGSYVLQSEEGDATVTFPKGTPLQTTFQSDKGKLVNAFATKESSVSTVGESDAAAVASPSATPAEGASTDPKLSFTTQAGNLTVKASE